MARRGGGNLSPGTAVKRINLLASIVAFAISEWSFPFPVNPASAEHATRPEDSDILRDRRLLPANPAAVRAAAIKGEKPPPDEETRLFTELAKSEWADDVLITRLAIEQAMRQGEIFALRWEDIDFDGRILTVRGRHQIGTKKCQGAEVQGYHRVGIPPAHAGGRRVAPGAPGRERTRPEGVDFLRRDAGQLQDPVRANGKASQPGRL